jgi:hypothetical protein
MCLGDPPLYKVVELRYACFIPLNVLKWKVGCCPLALRRRCPIRLAEVESYARVSRQLGFMRGAASDVGRRAASPLLSRVQQSDAMGVSILGLREFSRML